MIASPPHTTIECFWPGDPGAPGSRANRAGFRYRACVPGRIARWAPSLPSALAADLARGELAVRGLDRQGPLLAALARPLLRTEAIASSRIEGLSVSHHRLALAERAASDDPVAQAVAGNLAALHEVLARAGDDVSPGLFHGLHRALLRGGVDEGRAGRVRTTQNWIGGRHPYPLGAAFVPPPPEAVPALLADLAAFCRRDDLPAVAQAAIAHVQFETIHPYFDGNGRVGRAVVQVVLRRRGLAREVLPPVSLALAGMVADYVDGLTSFRRGNAGAWIELFNDAVFRASRAGEELAREILVLQETWTRRAGSPRRDSAAAALIRRLPEEPIVDLAGARRLTAASAQATLGGIARLVDAGVLCERSGRRRGRVWESVGLFGLLDQVETSIGAPRRRRDRTDAALA